MATFTGLKTSFSAIGNGETARTQVSNFATIGSSLTTHTFTGADVIYSFKVVSDSPSDVATLTLSAGTVAQTTGTPTITDAGEDFEGGALPTMTRVNAILVNVVDVNSSNVAISGFISRTAIADGENILYSSVTGTTTLTNLVLTFAAADQEVIVTVIAEI